MSGKTQGSLSGVLKLFCLVLAYFALPIFLDGVYALIASLALPPIASFYYLRRSEKIQNQNSDHFSALVAHRIIFPLVLLSSFVLVAGFYYSDGQTSFLPYEFGIIIFPIDAIIIFPVLFIIIKACVKLVTGKKNGAEPAATDNAV